MLWQYWGKCHLEAPWLRSVSTAGRLRASRRRACSWGRGGRGARPPRSAAPPRPRAAAPAALAGVAAVLRCRCMALKRRQRR